MRKEPFIENCEDLILGVNQQHRSIVNPDSVKAVDVKGNFIEPKKRTDKEIISVYWAKRRKKIAMVMLISTGILLSILVQETNMFDLIFGNILTVTIETFWFLVGLIS